MQIFLLRHGAAGPAPRGLPDGERMLTADGESQVQSVSRRAARLMPSPVILSSPYKRAVQTAEIIRRELGLESEILTSSALTPESSPPEAWREILIHRHAESLLAVGHQPLFSALAAFLLGFPGLDIEFATATLLCLDITNLSMQPRGILRWMLTVKLAG